MRSDDRREEWYDSILFNYSVWSIMTLIILIPEYSITILFCYYIAREMIVMMIIRSIDSILMMTDINFITKIFWWYYQKSSIVSNVLLCILIDDDCIEALKKYWPCVHWSIRRYLMEEKALVVWRYRETFTIDHYYSEEMCIIETVWSILMVAIYCVIIIEASISRYNH